MKIKNFSRLRTVDNNTCWNSTQMAKSNLNMCSCDKCLVGKFIHCVSQKGQVVTGSFDNESSGDDSDSDMVEFETEDCPAEEDYQLRGDSVISAIDEGNTIALYSAQNSLFIFYFINFFEMYTIYVKTSEILIRLCLIRKKRTRKKHNFTIFIQKSCLCKIFYFLAFTKVYSLKIYQFSNLRKLIPQSSFPLYIYKSTTSNLFLEKAGEMNICLLKLLCYFHEINVSFLFHFHFLCYFSRRP